MNTINNNDYASLNELLQHDKYEILIDMSFFYRFCELTKPFNKGWLHWIINHIEQLDEEPEHGDCLFIDMPPMYDTAKIAIHFVYCACPVGRESKRLMALIHEEVLEWQPDLDHELF